MYRPNHDYDCYIGIYDPQGKLYRFAPYYKYDNTFTRVAQTAGDAMGAMSLFNFGSTYTDFYPEALLVARPLRQGAEAIIEHKVGNSWTVSTISLYAANAETPRMVVLPAYTRKVAINLRIEDMGYDPTWYDESDTIHDPCDTDCINNLGLFFMTKANPDYSKLQLVKEADSQASYGRFLRDKLSTDLTFRGADFDRLVDDSVTEYAVCAVAFVERFAEEPMLDRLAACCYFNRAEADVNFSEHSLTPKLNTLDNYSWLLDKYSVQKNIVSIGTSPKHVKIPIPPIIQLYTLGAAAVTNICNDTSWEQEVSDPDISVNELKHRGFRLITGGAAAQIPHFATAPNEALFITIWERRTFAQDRYIFYVANPQTKEYAFCSTSGDVPDPSDEFPYDEMRFRYKNGSVEYYNPNTGAVLHSSLYNGHWLPILTNEYLDENFGTYGGIAWDGATSEFAGGITSQYTGIYVQPLWIRVLGYSNDAPDRYRIGDFATPSNWYNTIYADNDQNYSSISSWLKLQETNLHTHKPTEYGLYQPDLYYTNDGLGGYSYLSGLKPLPILKSWWGDYSFWVDLQGDTVSAQLATWTANVEVKDCYAVDDVIRRLFISYGVPFDFQGNYVGSKLLYGMTNSNPPVKLPNHLKCLHTYLIPASNITRGKYTQAAQKMMLSLKELLDELCMVCNAGWHIDNTGLHIEGNEYYDAGHTYYGFDYSSPFNFENIVDEFNNTNTLYGQIASESDTDSLWHTLSMEADDYATKHFSDTKMFAKAPFCKGDDSISPKFTFDLLEAVATDGVPEDGIIMLGGDSTYTWTYITHSGGSSIINLVHADKVDIFQTNLYEAKIGSLSSPMAARIMNKAYSWPYLKGRHLFGTPADISLMDIGWLQSAEYFSTMPKTYVKPHKTMKIRMPIVSDTYVNSWQLVKTTLGYGVIGRIDVDMISRVADFTVNILEY